MEKGKEKKEERREIDTKKQEKEKKEERREIDTKKQEKEKKLIEKVRLYRLRVKPIKFSIP
jgi:hypothetical protein